VQIKSDFFVLFLCSWRTFQRWTACLFLCDFCTNARSFWGVAAGKHCRDGLPACFYVIFARMRGHFGVLQLANIAEMDCLLVMFFCANAQSFWGVAAMDCLPFAFYNLAGVSTATFNDFFLAGTFTAY